MTSCGLFLFLPPSDSSSCLYLVASEGRGRKTKRGMGEDAASPHRVTHLLPQDEHGLISAFCMFLPPTPISPDSASPSTTAGHTGFPPVTRPCLLPSLARDRKQLNRPSKALPHAQTSLRILAPCHSARAGLLDCSGNCNRLPCALLLCDYPGHLQPTLPAPACLPQCSGF